MQLFPKSTKYKKMQKGRNFNKISKLLTINNLKTDCILLISTESGKISSKQLNSFRMCINKKIKKRGKLVLNTFPFIPISKKPTEVRMGKGKGNISHWVAKIKIGEILCRIYTSDVQNALNAVHVGRSHLPIHIKPL